MGARAKGQGVTFNLGFRAYRVRGLQVVFSSEKGLRLGKLRRGPTQSVLYQAFKSTVDGQALHGPKSQTY